MIEDEIGEFLGRKWSQERSPKTRSQKNCYFLPKPKRMVVPPRCTNDVFLPTSCVFFMF